MPKSPSGYEKSKAQPKFKPRNKVQALAKSNARNQSANASGSHPSRKLSHAADPEQMKRFIQFVHRGEPTVYQTFSRDPELASNSQTFRSARNKKLRDRLLDLNQKQKMNVAMLINKSRSGSRKRESITEINAVFIDSDDRKLKIDVLLSLKVRPHIVVETSSGRFHAYWFVSGCPVERFESIQKALAERFGTDASICDPSRVMRLPGTLNWKRKPPFMARIVFEHAGVSVPVSTLIKQLGLTVQPPRTKTKTKAVAKKTKGAAVTDAVQRLTTELTAKVRHALHCLPADDRLLWLRVGMAIHSAAANEQGYALWTAWSETSGRFDHEVQRSTWNGFTTSGGINIETLFFLANRARDKPSAFDDTDAARLFSATYADRLRYDPQRRQWYLFNGVVWREDGAAPARLAFKLIDDLSAGEGRQDPALRRYRGSTGPRAIVSQAELLEELHVDEASFDYDINLLAVKNGVIDLRTSEFREARPTDYLRRCTDVAYDVDVKCPVWRKFLTEVTCGDRELAMYLRLAVGYTLYGHANEQLFFMPEGSGSNGKGAFMRTIKAILGSYAGTIAPNLLTSAYSGNANGPSPALAALRGIRMGIVTEMVQKRSFDTAFIKQFAGGDEITARANYGDQSTFKPEGKLWISTNDMPEIAATDYAMWRRLIPIPFKAVFKGKNRDNDLEVKLLAERSGILNWMLSGARTYRVRGLEKCNAVAEHVRKLRKQADTLSEWISEACEQRPGAKLQASVAFSSYQGHVKRLGGVPISSHKFRERMEKLGFARTRTKNHNLYSGLRLVDVKK
jgi:putative DNA primase/helicase